MSSSEHKAATLSPSAASLSPSEEQRSSSPEDHGPVDFDKDGKWDEEDQVGPAIHAPDNVRKIVVDDYRIEWLNLSEPQTNFYAKNHMVATLIFAETAIINDVGYSSARLSMELGRIRKVAEIHSQKGFEPGDQYFPGIYTLMMLSYKSPTRRAVHHSTYPLREGTTIGSLIDMIVQQKMHHFLFLPYTREGRWKGCGDHVLHCWAHFVRQGVITTDQPIEPGAQPLSAEIIYTYLKPNEWTEELVGRGWWVSYDPVEDKYTPETIYTTRRLTYQLPRGSDDGANKKEADTEETNV